MIEHAHRPRCVNFDDCKKDILRDLYRNLAIQMKMTARLSTPYVIFAN